MLTRPTHESAQRPARGAVTSVVTVLGVPEAKEALRHAVADGEVLHASLEARTYVATALPLASDALEGAKDAQGMSGLTTSRTLGSVVLRSARAGVHQAAGPLLLYHLAGDRLA